jgi:hypothetical protein
VLHSERRFEPQSGDLKLLRHVARRRNTLRRTICRKELVVAVTAIQIENYQYYVFSSRDPSNSPNTVILLYDANNCPGQRDLFDRPEIAEIAEIDVTAGALRSDAVRMAVS